MKSKEIQSPPPASFPPTVPRPGSRAMSTLGVVTLPTPYGTQQPAAWGEGGLGGWRKQGRTLGSVPHAAPGAPEPGTVSHSFALPEPFTPGCRYPLQGGHPALHRSLNPPPHRQWGRGLGRRCTAKTLRSQSRRGCWSSQACCLVEVKPRVCPCQLTRVTSDSWQWQILQARSIPVPWSPCPRITSQSCSQPVPKCQGRL